MKTSFGKITFAGFPGLERLTIRMTCKDYGTKEYDRILYEKTDNTDKFETEYRERCVDTISFLIGVLRDAKVKTVEELVGKPVEITLDDCNWLKSFRILTEVL
jgi:predicted site-specific integrase-resolvase